MNWKVPVILDTDIGIDMDDTWALGLLLQCQELDLQLITTATGDTEYRTKIAAKFVDAAGYTVPIGIGKPTAYEVKPQEQWVKDYDLFLYSGGEIYKDGVGALIDVVRNSPEPVTIVCIGPLTNIAEALDRCPAIADNAKIVSMAGSIKKDVHGIDGKVAEWNIAQDIRAAQKVFSAKWPISITPLDTCGMVILRGEDYQKVHCSPNMIPQLIMQNYEVWDKAYGLNKFKIESSVLYDTVAVHMACRHDYLRMEALKLEITDDGYMQEDERGKEILCALEWNDLIAFESYLIEKLIGNLEVDCKEIDRSGSYTAGYN